MDYKDIINEQRLLLDRARKWWPIYLYHFSDIKNVVEILGTGWIFGRKQAESEKIMKNNNASSRVIELTSDDVKDCARLYMRPLTPTQYHNEGYKPKKIRNKSLNANCPVPVFLLLDAVKTLKMDGVKFVEKGCAGNYQEKGKIGVENFSKLKFDKIFHNGGAGFTDEIKKYRQTEVIREGGLPIERVLKGIVCRTEAEKQTLLFLLREQYPEAYKKYNDIISYKPELKLFYNNGAFIKNVKFQAEKLNIAFNDPYMRYNPNTIDEAIFNITINMYWLDNKLKIISRNYANGEFDYCKVGGLRVSFNNILSNKLLIEILFDDCLMYKTIYDLSEYGII